MVVLLKRTTPRESDFHAYIRHIQLITVDLTVSITTTNQHGYCKMTLILVKYTELDLCRCVNNMLHGYLQRSLCYYQVEGRTHGSHCHNFVLSSSRWIDTWVPLPQFCVIKSMDGHMVPSATILCYYQVEGRTHGPHCHNFVFSSRWTDTWVSLPQFCVIINSRDGHMGPTAAVS